MNIFEKYNKLVAYYETSDATKFFTENDAKNHAKTLKVKTVKTIKRAEQTPACSKTNQPVKQQHGTSKSKD